jgi:putative hydrolase of the HAD superfamily
MDPFVEIIRRNVRPLEPLATGESPVLEQLRGIRAVLFDVYGTLFISGSGDISTGSAMPRAQAMYESLGAVELDEHVNAEHMVVQIHEQIQRSHRQSRAAGVDWPEVDFVRIWLDAWHTISQHSVEHEPDRIRRLILEYEMRTNPVWPMPHVTRCLEQLQAAGLPLGLVSNAQFYTPYLFPALFDRTAASLGLADNLQFLSFRYGWAKPSTYLHRLAAESLRPQGLAAEAILYVGNDMRNDVWPAAQVGMRTALFAGDRRSLRRREHDPDLAACRPDLVVTDLAAIPGCVL